MRTTRADFRSAFRTRSCPRDGRCGPSPLYERLQKAGAQFGAAAGFEVPLWYAPPGIRDAFSWRRSTDFAIVAEEVHAVRAAVGLIETTGFAKYRIAGEGAAAWLDRLLACRLPPPGRMTLAPMLKHDGRLIGDFTLANLGPEGYLLIGSGVAEEYHLRWFQQHLGEAERVTLTAHATSMAGLAIAGPRARELLASVTKADVSASAFRFMEVRRLPLALTTALDRSRELHRRSGL